MERLKRPMRRIIDVREVQRELDRAARDARQGPAAVRAGRFVHPDARGDRLPAAAVERRAPHAPSSAPGLPRRKPVR
jgi:hypothetical protein